MCPSTNLFVKPRMGSCKFNLSCLQGKMRFKYVESKMISHVPDISDPERMPWEKNYPENVKYSGYQRTGNFGSDPSTESPHRTLHVPHWTLEAWVSQTEPWFLRFSSLSSFLRGYCLPASWGTSALPPSRWVGLLRPAGRNSSVLNKASLTM